MKAQLVRIGPVDDWVRTIAHHLGADPVVGSAERGALDRVLDALRGPLVLSCDIAGLNAVLLRLVRRGQVADVPLGWVADADRDSRALAASLGLPKRPTLAADTAIGDEVRAVRLVRDDHGGLLLHRGRLTAWPGSDRESTGFRAAEPTSAQSIDVGPRSARSFGAQAYHDDTRIADGRVRRIEVRPDYDTDCAVVTEVTTSLLRRPRRSTGRSVQTACAAALSTVDGVAHPRPVTRWTWYADPRQHWLLREPGRSA